MYHHLGQVPTAEILRERMTAPAWTPVSGPDLVAWDPTRRANPTAGEVLNRGCPVGYFAQLVAPGEALAVDYGNPASWIRCRRLAGTSAKVIQAEVKESGTSWRETAALYAGAIRDTAGISGRPGAWRAFSWLPNVPRWGAWALGGAAALVVVTAAAVGVGKGITR